MIFRALLPVDAQSLERESSRSGDDGLAVLVILVRRPGVDGQHNRCAPSGPDDGIVICRAIHSAGSGFVSDCPVCRHRRADAVVAGRVSL